MPNMTQYLGWNTDGDLENWYDDALRSDSIGFIIGHRGTSVTLYRDSAFLTAQSMLVVPISTAYAQKIGVDSGEAAGQQLLIVTLRTVDIKRQDRFSYNATPSGRLNYEVERVEKLYNGMYQAIASEIQ